MKKLTAVLILMAMFASQLAIVEAQEDYTWAADELKELGMFRGTNKGYELERAPSRIEGGIMFVRLLGKEAQVLSGSYTHPFTDVPAWADQYIGFMYENGYTTGVGNNKYGSESALSGAAFMTFILRAMGYKDGEHFIWYNSIFESHKIGILDWEDYDAMNAFADKGFLRGHAAFLALKSLEGHMAAGEGMLLKKLIDEGAITKDQLTETSLAKYADDYFMTDDNNPFIMSNITVGYQVSTMTVESVGDYIVFDGDLVLEGTYNHYAYEEDFEGYVEGVSFTVTGTSIEKLPRLENDQRTPWFVLADYQAIKDLFGDANTTGSATITISKYHYNTGENGFSNFAVLKSVELH